MVPATMTVGAVMASAASTVGEFGPLIVIVASLGLGIWGVRFVIGLVRRAKG